MKAKGIIASIICIVSLACSGGRWTEAEKAVINSSASGMMRVLRTDDRADSTFLRKQSAEIAAEDFDSPELETLIERMLATVTDTTQTGVGIAAPQVGILRRLILVQRFDKPNEEFEAYINPRIVWYSDSLAAGDEGCLSVPDIYGEVMRSDRIAVEYDRADGSGRTSDTVSGFTAVIFQHETDHLDGILFTDRMNETVK